MAPTIPVPFVNRNLDLGDPASAVMTFLLIVGGFAVMTLGQDLGGSVANRLSQMLGVGSGAQQNSGPNIL